MSLLNQPSRILISGDDAEWSSNSQYGGQYINLTLPEPVVGAKGVDCGRAVIPTTQYNIPNYQNTFYYTVNNVVDSIVLTNNRYFATISDLVTQLNADAVAQGKNVVFTYDTTTTRISASFTNQLEIVVTALNKGIGLTYSPPASPPTISIVANIAEGTYNTLSSFATAVQTAIQAVVNTEPTTAQPAYDVWAGVVSSPMPDMLGIAITGTPAYPGTWAIDYWGTPLTSQQIEANQQILGITVGSFTNFPLASSLTSPPTAPTTFNNPIGFTQLLYTITPKSSWPTKFSLNTRLGFPNAGLTVPTLTYIGTGTFLPNILRTRVIYLLCNVSVNDSITTDGLRNVLAKIPVNSIYGGMTIYQPPDFNFCEIVQSSYQNIELSLLDENYQPYNLTIEEPMEIELVFSYKDIDNSQ